MRRFTFEGPNWPSFFVTLTNQYDSEGKVISVFVIVNRPRVWDSEINKEEQMKNRNVRGNGKRAERQVRISGKLPYHRVAKQYKLHQRLIHLS